LICVKKPADYVALQGAPMRFLAIRIALPRRRGDASSGVPAMAAGVMERGPDHQSGPNSATGAARETGGAGLGLLGSRPKKEFKYSN
jgi:hypothetical protein